METPTYSQDFLEAIEREHKSDMRVRGLLSFAIGFITALVIIFSTTLN